MSGRQKTASDKDASTTSATPDVQEGADTQAAAIAVITPVAEDGAIFDTAQPTAEQPERTDHPLTPDEAFRAFLDALILDQGEVASITIDAEGRVKVYTVDRVMFTRRIQPLERYKRDENGYYIRGDRS